MMTGLLRDPIMGIPAKEINPLSLRDRGLLLLKRGPKQGLASFQNQNPKAQP